MSKSTTSSGLTEYQKKLILEIASQLRLAVKNKNKLKCSKLIGLSADSPRLATFTCTLPYLVFDCLYYLIND
jgi:hypothetical protein